MFYFSLKKKYYIIAISIVFKLCSKAYHKLNYASHKYVFYSHLRILIMLQSSTIKQSSMICGIKVYLHVTKSSLKLYKVLTAVFSLNLLMSNSRCEKTRIFSVGRAREEK